MSETETHEPDVSTLQVKRIRPAYEQVADQIRNLILSQQLLPGQQLPVEGKLSATFGVSRSTVREALRVLSAQGLIQTSRGVSGGTFVSDTTARTVTASLENSLALLSGSEVLTRDDLFEAREMFEVPATRLAAERATPEHLAALRGSIDQEAASLDRNARFEHNSRFHELLLEACGNALVAVMVEPIFSVIRSRFLRDDVAPGFWPQVDTDHLDILHQVEQGDADAAAAAMHGHLKRIRATYQSCATVDG